MNQISNAIAIGLFPLMPLLVGAIIVRLVLGEPVGRDDDDAAE